MSSNKDTGAQILLSHTLFVIKFSIVAITEKETTNQIAVFVKESQSGYIIPDSLNTIEAINVRIIDCKKEAIRIAGGYLPGNFPPIA